MTRRPSLSSKRPKLNRNEYERIIGVPRRDLEAFASRKELMERVAITTSLGKLLDWCTKQQATDLHAQAGHPFAYRVDGKLRRIKRRDGRPAREGLWLAV